MPKMNKQVQYYDVGRKPMDWNDVTTLIERQEAWAVIHDHKRNQYEVWVEGHLRSTYPTSQDAERALKSAIAEFEAGKPV